jgi:hypothetical protein
MPLRKNATLLSDPDLGAKRIKTLQALVLALEH